MSQCCDATPADSRPHGWFRNVIECGSIYDFADVRVCAWWRGRVGSDRQTGDDQNGNVRGSSSGKLIPLMDSLSCCPLVFTAARSTHLTGDALLLLDAALFVFFRK